MSAPPSATCLLQPTTKTKGKKKKREKNPKLTEIISFVEHERAIELPDDLIPIGSLPERHEASRRRISRRHASRDLQDIPLRFGTIPSNAWVTWVLISRKGMASRPEGRPVM